MRNKRVAIIDYFPAPEPSFEEKMREGASLKDGLGGSMKFEPENKPYYRDVHKPTRTEHDGKDY